MRSPETPAADDPALAGPPLLPDRARDRGRSRSESRETIDVPSSLQRAIAVAANDLALPPESLVLAVWSVLLQRASGAEAFEVDFRRVERGTVHDAMRRRVRNDPEDTWRDLARRCADAPALAAEEPAERWILEMAVDSGIPAALSVAFDACVHVSDTLRRMLARTLALLETATARPDSLVAEASILAPGEFEEVVHRFNATGRDYEPGLRLFDWLLRHATARPEAVALEFGDERTTYAELERLSATVARRLKALGVGRDDRVAVCLRRSTWLPVALFGVVRAGAAYVPVDPDLPAERVAFLLSDSGARVVLHGLDAPPFPDSPAKFVALPLGNDDAAAETTDRPEIDDASPRDLAYVIYTSGSTGRPKGSLVEHRSIVNRLLWMQEQYPFSGDDVQLQTTTITFDVSVVELFMWSVAGARLTLPPPGAERDPDALVRAIERHRVTRLHFVPSMLSVFFAHVAAAGTSARLRSLRQVYCSGEALPVSLVREFDRMVRTPFGATLHNLYGPTEAAVEVSWFDCADLGDRASVPIGRPVANTRLHVLDTHGRPCPVGIPGELHIAGVQVARGYHGRPELTAEKFVPEPFVADPEARMYRTGDLARWLPDGTVEYLGRTDFQIKIRGVRVEPGEIEAVLCEEPDVGAAAVIAVQGPAGDTRLAAYVAPRPGWPSPPVARLLAVLRERLPQQLVPASLDVLERLPLGSTGKLDRKRLPSPTAQEGVAESGLVHEDATAATIAEIWQDVVGLPVRDASVSFFDQGGHSLLAGRLLAEIRARIGAVVALPDFLRRADFGSLVALVRAAGSAASTSSIPRADRSGDAPATEVQKQFWFQHQLDAAGTGHNLVFTLRMRGPLDVSALRAAFDSLVARHETLRTLFPAVGGEPRQLVLAADDPRAPRLGEVVRTDLDALRDAEEQRVLDVEAIAVCVATLARIGAEEHALVLTLHHLATDEVTEEILWRDLARAYASAPDGGAKGAEPGLLLHPVDFAVWENTTERLALGETQLAWWRQELSDLGSGDILPTDSAGKTTPSFSGRRVHRYVDAATYRAFTMATRTCAATPFVGMLAAWSAFLHRLCGVDDLCVGAPVSRRHLSGLEASAGLFIAPLPFRSRRVRGCSFLEAIRAARETVLRVHEHSAVSLPTIVRNLRAHASAGGMSLFATMLVMRGAPVQAPTLPGLETSLVEQEPRSAKVDLTLLVAERDGSLLISLEYRDDSFAQSTAAAWLEDFTAFLASVSLQPAAPLDHAPLVSKASRERLLALARGPALPATDFADMTTWIEAAMRAASERDAVAGVLGYAELDRRSRAMATALHAKDVGPESLVGLCGDRNADAICAIVGILRAGAGYVPFDPDSPPARVLEVARRAGVRLIFAAPRTVSVLSAAVAPGEPLEIVSLQPPATTDEDVSVSPPRARIHDSATAYVVHTSGSTGRPKGVVVEHRQLVASTLARLSCYGPNPPRFLLVSPLFFDSSVAGLFHVLATGGTLVLPAPGDERDPEALARLVVEARVTHVLWLPSMHRWVLEHLRGCHHVLDTVIVAGETCPADLPALHREVLPGTKLYNEYGPTEATVWCSVARIDERSRPHARVPIGRPIAGARLFVVDSNLRLLPEGAIGELVVAGPGLARGYSSDPETTRSSFVEDGLADLPESRIYRTGDRARWNTDGMLEFHGRNDAQVKVRGHRIEPSEIETAVLESSAVADVAVVVHGADSGSGVLVAHAVASDARTHGVDAERALLARLSARLPAYMIPNRVEWHDTLPRTATGKVDRAELARRAAPVRVSSATRRRTPSPLEESLLRIWRDVLGTAEVEPADDFFDLGGHSLLAIRLCHLASEALGRRISVRDLLRHRSVERLAAALEDDARAAAMPGTVAAAAGVSRDALRGEGAGTPLFNIPGFGGVGLMPRELSQAIAGERRWFDALVLRGVDDGEAPRESVEEVARDLVEQIRAAHPHGPYALTGFCLGGVFAMEVAHQLVAAGEEVRALALWHTFPVHLWKPRGSLARIACLLRWSVGPRSVDRARLLESPASYAVGRLRHRLSLARRRLLGRPLANPTGPEVDGPPNAWKQAQSAAADHYHMRPYAGPLLVLRGVREHLADALPHERSDAWGWETIARGPFTMHDVDADHMRMIAPPHLAQIAAITASWLRDVDAAAIESPRPAPVA
jgi:amino acid adenylation domain-containing protein